MGQAVYGEEMNKLYFHLGPFFRPIGVGVGGGGEAGIESRGMIQRLASDRKVRGVDWQMGEGSDRN